MPERHDLGRPAIACSVCAGSCPVEDRWTCPSCGTAIHESCHRWIGGCSRYACAEAGTVHRRMAHYVEARRADARRAARLEIALLATVAVAQAARGGLEIVLPLIALTLAILADSSQRDERMARLEDDAGGDRALAGALAELRPTRVPWALRRGGVVAGILMQVLLIPFSLLTITLLFVAMMPAEGLHLVELVLVWLVSWKLFGQALLVSNRSDQLALDWQEEIEAALATGSITEHCLCPGTRRGDRSRATGEIRLIETRL